MKSILKKHGIGRLVSIALAFSMILAMVPATVFADDTTQTQTIYIGGRKLEVPMEKASYWKYNEGTGEIKACSEADANVVINAEAKYDPASAIVVNLKNVKIYSNPERSDQTEDCFQAGIYCPDTFLELRINGECHIEGASYGVYGKEIRITPRDTAAKLTIVGNLNRASSGKYAGCALYSSGSIEINPGCEHRDFSVILKSSTKNLTQGGGETYYNGSTVSILTSSSLQGDNATKYVPDENGRIQLGDMSDVRYMEYKVGSRVFDKAEITGATLQFNAGDTPVFTAQVAAGEEGKYFVWSEQWCELDENGNKVKWCSSYQTENPQDESQLLKTFEAGKTYYYSATIVTNSVRDSFIEKMPVIINGESFTITNKAMLGDYLTIYATNIKSMTVPSGQVPEGIKAIDVTNATLTYHAGDTPKATATLSGENAAKYKIVYEYWEEMEKQSDGSVVPVRFWYSDAAENAKLADDKKITAFEEGKSYMYSIKLEVVNGNSFASVASGLTMTLNGEAVNTKNMTVSADGTSVFVTALKTLKPTAGQSAYKFLEGENGSWTQNSDGTLRFRANGEFNKFTGVMVDDVLVSADNYTAQSGSTIVVFKSSYLKGLSAGTHKITVVYTDGECSANFEVKQVSEGVTSDTATATVATTATTTAKTPKTGDDSHPLVWIFWLVAACGGMAGCTIYGKRRNGHN